MHLSTLTDSETKGKGENTRENMKENRTQTAQMEVLQCLEREKQKLEMWGKGYPRLWCGILVWDTERKQKLKKKKKIKIDRKKIMIIYYRVKNLRGEKKEKKRAITYN